MTAQAYRRAPAGGHGRPGRAGRSPGRGPGPSRARSGSTAGPGRRSARRSGPAGPRRPRPAARPRVADVPCRSSRSASMAKARPRSSGRRRWPGGPACASGAMAAARSSAVAALSTWTSTAARTWVLGHGVAGQQRRPGQLCVAQGRHHRLVPVGLRRRAASATGAAAPPARWPRPARRSRAIRPHGVLRRGRWRSDVVVVVVAGVVVVVVGRVVGSSRWSCVGRGRGREVDVVVVGCGGRGGGRGRNGGGRLVTATTAPEPRGPAAMAMAGWHHGRRPSPRPPGRPRWPPWRPPSGPAGPAGTGLMPPARRPGPRCAAAWPGSSGPRRRDGG